MNNRWEKEKNKFFNYLDHNKSERPTLTQDCELSDAMNVGKRDITSAASSPLARSPPVQHRTYASKPRQPIGRPDTKIPTASSPAVKPYGDFPSGDAYL